MRNPYQNYDQYPSHLVDPLEKGREWILQYCKAAYGDYTSVNRGSFFNNRNAYYRLKEYAQGNQSINKYKRVMGVDGDSDETWLAIDWSILPILPKYRRIALGKLNKIDYNITAQAIDPVAVEEKEDYFANVKAKLMMKETLVQQGMPNLAQNPKLALGPQDPKTPDEIALMENYTYKHAMSIEMEQAIRLVFEQNDVSEIRKRLKEDLFDFGVAAVKEFIDPANNQVRMRRVNPSNVIISHCSKNDFSDASHVGEIYEMTIQDLKRMAGNQFSEEEYQDIAGKVLNQYGNPRAYPANTPHFQGYDKFKVQVLDIEIMSVDDIVFESRIDRRGNKVFARAKYQDRNKRKQKYKRTSYKVVYRGKWIIGTDYIFNFGKLNDQKRKKNQMTETSFSYHLYAPDMHNMKCLGILEQCVTIADSIQIAHYRLQNVINSARPKGIMIELGALEDVALGSGGADMTPMQILDLYNQTGTLVYRRNDLSGRPTNYRPIEELENGIGRDASAYYQIIQQQIQMLQQITGLNQFTDGSTPPERALNQTAQLAAQATNNSLSYIIDGDRHLLESVAKSVVIRVQDLASGGNLKGYVSSLGQESVNFFKASAKLSVHDFGIIIEDRPDDEGRARLMQLVQASLGQGALNMEDAALIEDTPSLRVAQQILAFRMRMRKKEEEQKAMQQQQTNSQMQQQAAQAAEQAKQQTIQLEHQQKMELAAAQFEADKQLLEMKLRYQRELENMRQGVKVGLGIREMDTVSPDVPTPGAPSTDVDGIQMEL